MMVPASMDHRLAIKLQRFQSSRALAWTAGPKRATGKEWGRIVRGVAGLAVLLGLAFCVHSQAPTHGTDPTYSAPNVGGMSPEAIPGTYGRLDPAEVARREQAHKVEIRQSVESDTNKLLKLAKELDDEISSTSPDALTSSQLKKIAEIGKLAHKVKDKMSEFDRGSTATLPIVMPPPPARPQQ